MLERMLVIVDAAYKMTFTVTLQVITWIPPTELLAEERSFVL